jgi:hypothetical protein
MVQLARSIDQSIHFMALANAECVKPLEPDKKPPATEMLAISAQRPKM